MLELAVGWELIKQINWSLRERERERERVNPATIICSSPNCTMCIIIVQFTALYLHHLSVYCRPVSTQKSFISFLGFWVIFFWISPTSVLHKQYFSVYLAAWARRTKSHQDHRPWDHGPWCLWQISGVAKRCPALWTMHSNKLLLQIPHSCPIQTLCCTSIVHKFAKYCISPTGWARWQRLR